MHIIIATSPNVHSGIKPVLFSALGRHTVAVWEAGGLSHVGTSDANSAIRTIDLPST